MTMDDKYTVIGVVSGTSLDGVDIVLCDFRKINNEWQFEIIDSNTYPYNNEWRSILSNINYFTQTFMKILAFILYF